MSSPTVCNSTYDPELLPPPLTLPWNLENADWAGGSADWNFGATDSVLDNVDETLQSSYLNPIASSTALSPHRFQWPVEAGIFYLPAWNRESSRSSESTESSQSSEITEAPPSRESTESAQSSENAASPQSGKNSNESAGSSTICRDSEKPTRGTSTLQVKRGRSRPTSSLSTVMTRAAKLRNKKLILLDAPVQILHSRTRSGVVLK